MKIFWQTSIYKLLNLVQISNTSNNIRVLDCGAGGNMPSLALFEDCGYSCDGIDISDTQIELANNYLKKNDLSTRIQYGDMRKLDYDDEYYDCIYSYNTIFHMKKHEIINTIEQMKRILKPGGILFINLLSIDDFRCGEGLSVGENEYLQMEDGIQVIHSYFKHSEADNYFSDMTLLSKETRIWERTIGGKLIKQGYIDYILKK